MVEERFRNDPALHRTAPKHLNTELPIVTALVNSYVKNNSKVNTLFLIGGRLRCLNTSFEICDLTIHKELC